ncbi:hypothetical protein E0485_20985 [Paenibacillus albiflavus]|uniref:Uncharacterized protein n=1 Tax=Paenibacillus albiflavus TaxID=2545760 RepID=A0A4R4E421_9BACL|nr:hypothetical protein [Paenibacillus albiflavus]TCZ73583.1 hypothetical protein E0485_20985 [Paenibacillus albiflavus]
MSQVTVETVVTEVWGRCVQITNEHYKLIASLEFGPRILHFGLKDGSNVLMVDEHQAIRNESKEMDVFGKGAWKLYGGHRLWTSPEELPRTYYPDHDDVIMETIADGVILRAPIENWTNVQKEIKIVMIDDKVHVNHGVRNQGAWPIELAAWALSVMKPGGEAIIPHVRRETGLLPNRTISLWPYCNMADSRVTWGDKYITVKQCTDAEGAFKLGTNNEEGWAGYYVDGVLFRKQHHHDVCAAYPDNNSSLEVYSCTEFLELETLGPLVTLKRGEETRHHEVWELIPIANMQSYLAAL